MFTRKGLLAFALIISCSVALPVLAQDQMQLASASMDHAADIEWQQLFKMEKSAVPATLSGLDLNGLSKEEWKAVRKEQLTALRSADTWVNAAHNIIYLSSFYGDKVNFQKAGPRLFKRFVSEQQPERNRIMALAGIYAVENDDTMRYLGQFVRVESSSKIRRLTIAAVNSYYSEGEAIVGPLERVR